MSIFQSLIYNKKMSWLNMQASNGFNYNSQYCNNFFLNRVEDQSSNLFYQQQYQQPIIIDQHAVDFTEINHQSDRSPNQTLQDNQAKLISASEEQSHQWINKGNSSRKGLKKLAFWLFRILKQNSPLTQTKLVSSVETYLFKTKKNETNKQEKNIKRRIYDALNVMISAGLLRRQLSYIYFKPQQSSATFIDISLLKLRQLQSIIDKKRELYIKLLSITQAIKLWFAKNKQEADKSHKHLQKLYFPLFFVLKQQNSQFQMEMIQKQLLIINQGLPLLSEADLIESISDMKVSQCQQ